jgi:hypothetical protein
VKCAKIIRRLYRRTLARFQHLATVVQFDAVALISSPLIKIFKRTVEKLKTRTLGFTQNCRRAWSKKKLDINFNSFVYINRDDLNLRGKGSKKLLASGSEPKNKVVARTHAWGVGKNSLWRRSHSVLAYFKRCANGSHILLDEFISRS